MYWLEADQYVYARIRDGGPNSAAFVPHHRTKRTGMLVVARKASRRSGQFTSRLVTAKVIGICAVYAAIARSYYYSDLGRSVMYVHALVSNLLLPSKKTRTCY